MVLPRSLTIQIEALRLAWRRGRVRRLPFLIIATGASTPSPLLGLNRDENFLRESWAEFRKALPEAKSIVIAGGGPAGVEVGGELGEYLNGRPGWFGSKPSKPQVTITIINSSPNILPALRPAIAKKAEDYLAQVGVTVVKNSRVKSVSPEGAGTTELATKTTLTLDDGKTVDADLYVPATGMSPNTGFIDKALITADGRVNTNPSTLRVDAAGPRIYAIGDVASTARPAVHLILNAIPVICANIKRDLLLEAGVDDGEVGKDREYMIDMTETQLVPIGKKKGVGAAMGWALPSWVVWDIKGRDYWLWTTGGLWSGAQWNKES